MVLQRLRIGRLIDILQYLEDDARVPVLVEVQLLVVGDFSDLAARVLVALAGGRNRGVRKDADLASPYAVGRSTVMAPP